MFRGWSQSFLGPVGSIVLSSALWALMHIQYDWLGCFRIFLIGLESRPFSLAQQFDVADRDGPFSFNILQLSYDGPRFRPSSSASAIAIGIVIAARIVCSVMICASSGASPPICRAIT